jgi:hypothetical protein
MTEAPLISKALRLLSIAVIVGMVALVASLGYSGYQEFQVLSGGFSSGGNNNSSPFSANFTGSAVTVVIPNNMTYPLDVQLLGSINLGGTNIGTFASPVEQILPGQSMPISVPVSLDYEKVLSNQSALNSLLFGSTSLTFATKISANIVPLVGINLSTSSSSNIPGIFANLNLSPGTLTNTSQGWSLPLGISWDNPSPVAFNGGLTVAVTSIPGYSGGSLPSASVPLDVQANEEGSATPTLLFTSNQLQYLQPGQQIGLALTFSVLGANVTVSKSVTVP